MQVHFPEALPFWRRNLTNPVLKADIVRLLILFKARRGECLSHSAGWGWGWH